MYQHYVDFLPKPNSNPIDPRQEPTNNYLVRTYTDPIQSQIYGARLDYNHSNSHRFFGRWSGSYFTEGLDDWTYQSVGIHSEDMKRTTNAGTGNWTWVKSSSTVIDAQLSANTFHEGGERKTLAEMRSSDVGLPAYLDEKCAASDAARTGSSRGSSCALPRVEIAGYQTFGDNAAEGYDTTNLQVTANMTHVRANHTLKFGTDMRRHSRTGFLPGASQGLYSFDPTLHAAVLRHGAGDAGQSGLELGGVHARHSDDIHAQHAGRLLHVVSLLLGVCAGSVARRRRS